MTMTDATRLSGETYRTYPARVAPAITDDKTRLARDGYQSKLAREAVGVQPDADEFYKIGDKIGDRFEVAVIHHGAMGVVYGCFDHQTKLPRALKSVRARYAHDKQVLSMFESEAAVWISLEKHPYIVRAYKVQSFKNLPYVITEYVRGSEGMEGDLRGWLGHPRLTLPVAVAMALQIAQGMQHAVRKVSNLVHRDLKPANILVNDDGKAMVTDFGLVQAAQSSAGTPAYMSPEQWRDEALDARSDIYAYGCILFEMFTAHRLFPALTEREWRNAHLWSVPATLTSLVPEMPGDVSNFVLRCLEKDSAGRPQNWDDIVAFFAEWYHRLTGKAVVLDFSSLALDAGEWLVASYSLSCLQRYQEMLLASERALAIDPTLVNGWSYKGYALNSLKRYGEAIQAHDRALAIDPNFAARWGLKGSALNNLERYEEAIQALDRALAIDPNDATVWSHKGTSLSNLKRHNEALQAWEQALTLKPDDANAWFEKGHGLVRLERYEEALTAYDHASSLDSKGNVSFIMGFTLKKMQRYEESICACNRALALDPDNPTFWLTKGDVLSKLKRHEDALEAYDKALTLNPAAPDCWLNKGATLDTLKRYKEAIETYDRGLAIDANSWELWYNKGNVLYHLKRYNEAIHAWDGALAIDPNSLIAWYNKGTAFYHLNLYEKAIQAYDRALVIDPTHVSVLKNKDLALQQLKSYAKSPQTLANAKDAVALRPSAALKSVFPTSDLKSAPRTWFSWRRFLDK